MSETDRDALLAAFLEGSLDDADRARLARELRTDAAFKKQARELRALERLMELELDPKNRGGFVWKVTEKVREIAAQNDEKGGGSGWQEGELSLSELEAVAGGSEPPPPPPDQCPPDAPPPAEGGPPSSHTLP